MKVTERMTLAEGETGSFDRIIEDLPWETLSMKEFSGVYF